MLTTVNMIERHLYDRLRSTRISTLIMNKIFIRVLKIMTMQTITEMLWICSSSCTNCMFHFLQEVDAKRRVTK